MASVNIAWVSLVLIGIINGLSFAIGIFLYEYFLKQFVIRGKDKLSFTFNSVRKRLISEGDFYDGKKKFRK